MFLGSGGAVRRELEVDSSAAPLSCFGRLARSRKYCLTTGYHRETVARPRVLHLHSVPPPCPLMAAALGGGFCRARVASDLGCPAATGGMLPHSCLLVTYVIADVRCFGIAICTGCKSLRHRNHWPFAHLSFRFLVGIDKNSARPHPITPITFPNTRIHILKQ